MSSNPEQFFVEGHPWQVFCTMTFASKSVVGDMLSERARYGAAYALFRFAAKIQGIPFNRLLWVLRTEHGEKGGRFHFHALLDSPRAFTVNHRYQLWNWWTSHPTAPWAKTKNIGRSDFRIVRPGDAAGFYTCKDSPRGVDPSLQYEVFKPGEKVLTLSDSFSRFIEARRKHKSCGGLLGGRTPQG